MSTSFSFKSNGQVFTMRAKETRKGYVATGRLQESGHRVKVIIRKIEEKFQPTLLVDGYLFREFAAKPSAEKAFAVASKFLPLFN